MQAPYSSKEKEHYTGQALRERMIKLDFKEGFVEKMLKEYSLKKIEEKLDLLLERKNIKSPAGWLRAALKNDYRGEEQESRSTAHPHLNPPPSRGRRFIDCPPSQRGRRFIDCPHPQKGETVSSIEYRVYGEEKTKKEMDSRVRENDIGRSGNDPSETRFHGAGIKVDGNDKILSTEEVKKRFHSLREKLMAMKSP